MGEFLRIRMEFLNIVGNSSRKRSCLINALWLQSRKNASFPAPGLGLEEETWVPVTAPLSPAATFPVRALGMKFLAEGQEGVVG